MKTKGNNRVVMIVASILLVIILLVILINVLTDVKEYSYSDFESSIREGQIESIYVSGNYKVFYIFSQDSKVTKSIFSPKYDGYSNIDSRLSVVETVKEIEEEQLLANPEFKAPVVIFNDPSEGAIWQTLLPILLGVLLIAVFLVIMYRQSNNQNNKAMSFGTTKARVTSNIKVRFSDVAGAEEEKEELKEIVDFLKNPAKFQQVGAKIPKGVLLVGEPGTGKTLFAKAIAGEANVPFFSISGSDFVEMFVGVGASRVRDLFAQAKRNMPCIVFIDEIDAVGRQRGAGFGGGHDEREQTLNQLLVQMDGFEHNDGIIIIAATNRADILDPALLRPGRFDRQIVVHVPDVRGREEILRVHARNKPLAGDIDFKTVARITMGFTGADLANLLNEAAILAARQNRHVIIMEDILEGINKVIMGPQKKSRVVTEIDKRITAYHESGHAIVARCLKYADDVQEVSIIPRGMASGYTLTLPESDDHHYTKNKLNDTIAMMLGGRAAEAIVIKDITTGASNDIERASGLARRMVTTWGMSDEIGNIFLGGDQEIFLGRSYQQHSNISEVMAGKIDAAIKDIIDTNYQRAIDILNEHREIMDTMVRILFEKETIYAKEIDMIFDGKTYEEIIAFINSHPQRNSYEKIIDDAEKTKDDELEKAQEKGDSGKATTDEYKSSKDSVKDNKKDADDTDKT